MNSFLFLLIKYVTKISVNRLKWIDKNMNNRTIMYSKSYEFLSWRHTLSVYFCGARLPKFYDNLTEMEHLCFYTTLSKVSLNSDPFLLFWKWDFQKSDM